MKLKSSQMLSDSSMAIARFINAENDLDRRLYWILSLTMLRGVGHTLDKRDAIDFPELREAVDEKWKNIQDKVTRDLSLKERNSALKEYELNFNWVPYDITDNEGMVLSVEETLQYTGKHYPPGTPPDHILNEIYEFWRVYIEEFERMIKKI
ncbi:hypothetical protein A9Q84_00110 [Halobacteriovorax marinus]|uniref:Uncharacterized protein n=1 Tax=Halobacteriovorax marinus TaxID=97084 RepID=A0A1Y5FD12_9BACT|nr:hypothetical protein A9Q84_00110 [Halobacteriovorax marinus]